MSHELKAFYEYNNYGKTHKRHRCSESSRYSLLIVIIITLLIIIMYIYHKLINALSAHMIHVNLNMIFYTHVEHSPTKTIYIRYYMHTHTHTQ